MLEATMVATETVAMAVTAEMEVVVATDME